LYLLVGKGVVAVAEGIEDTGAVGSQGDPFERA